MVLHDAAPLWMVVAFFVGLFLAPAAFAFLMLGLRQDTACEDMLGEHGARPATIARTDAKDLKDRRIPCTRHSRHP